MKIETMEEIALVSRPELMESRYQKMSLLGVRNIENYNLRIKESIKKSQQIFSLMAC